jgi:dihydroorotate dehydrogenase electron transfer subunit
MIARRDHDAEVTSLEPLSPTCFRLRLRCAGELAAAPGQFAMVRCGEGFDPLLRRAFSIAGVAADGDGTLVELMVKEVGKGTSLLRRTGVGTRVRLLAPLGNAFSLPSSSTDRVALLAGGIGLPPLLFAAETLARRAVPFDLYVGAATAVELLEIERCSAAVASVGGELILTTDDGSRGEAGLVTAALERRLASGRGYAQALACGPNPMLRAVGRVSRERGLPAELSLEEPMACGVGVCLGCVVELADGRFVASCKEGPVFPVARLAARWSS